MEIYVTLNYTCLLMIFKAGSFYSPIYYTFSCYPLLVMFFNGGITLLGIGAICVTFHPAFEKPGYDAIRASVFVGMALFGVTCAPIAIYLFGVESLWGVCILKNYSFFIFSLIIYLDCLEIISYGSMLSYWSSILCF